MRKNVKIAIFLFFTLFSIIYRLIPLKLPNVEFFSSLIAFVILSYDYRIAIALIPPIILFSDLILKLVLKVPFDLRWELVVIIGWLLVIATQTFFRGKKILNVVLMEVFGTFAFYFITNSLVFFVFNFYPKSITGYFTCMIAGIPFLRNQVFFNLVFSLVIFATVNELGFGKELERKVLRNENS